MLIPEFKKNYRNTTKGGGGGGGGGGGQAEDTWTPSLI